jgi:hypothetical protein
MWAEGAAFLQATTYGTCRGWSLCEVDRGEVSGCMCVVTGCQGVVLEARQGGYVFSQHDTKGASAHVPLSLLCSLVAPTPRLKQGPTWQVC